jgi:hypothetical protein
VALFPARYLTESSGPASAVAALTDSLVPAVNAFGGSQKRPLAPRASVFLLAELNSQINLITFIHKLAR